MALVNKVAKNKTTREFLKSKLEDIQTMDTAMNDQIYDQTTNLVNEEIHRLIMEGELQVNPKQITFEQEMRKHKAQVKKQQLEDTIK